MGDDDTQIPPTPPMFYVVERLSGERWAVLDMLFSLETASMASVASTVATRLRSVDLGTGWAERADSERGATHASGAETKASGKSWRWRSSPGAVWQETLRGPWYARWAALGYEVGPIVSLLG